MVDTPEPRKPLTPSQRLKLFDDHNGICCICGHPIDPDKPWRDEHIRALGLLGTNDLANRGPAHEACAREKDKDDIPRIAKAKNQRKAYLGIKKPKGRPLPGTRASGIRLRMNRPPEKW